MFSSIPILADASLFPILKIIAFQLGMIAALGAYLSSKQQVLLPKAISKSLAWGQFSVNFLLSALLLCTQYHPLAAAIVTLVIVMLSWVVLAICAPYAPDWRVIVPAYSAVLLATALMGGAHVG
ncbi:hypothetical protein [Planctobacterium marinum]|uniref:hypothetical protein n=1 Tax=Planctobacterium marinum TaxID=1631968 RepID=UPI001E350C32|nr:hypothetical protein [Planctobacterium marinum]MCC2607448.1 hypothetical protein [Planctobacterium marinum]